VGGIILALLISSAPAYQMAIASRLRLNPTTTTAATAVIGFPAAV